MALDDLFHDESDPNAVAGEFDAFPEGEVVVCGVHSFVKVDDQGIPLYTEKDGRLFTIVKLALADGSEGPPLSMTPAEVVLMVIAFAGEATVNLLPQDRTSAAFLMKAAQLANCRSEEQKGRTPTKQTAYVGKKGWVRNMTGMNLPTNTIFRFAVDDIRNLDGTLTPLRFMEHSAFKQMVINVRFRVVGDVFGKATIYDGATTSVFMEQPFTGEVREHTNAEGKTLKTPVLRINSNRSRPKAVTRMFNFIRVYAPELAEYEWIADPLRSSYGTDETINPIVVIADRALRSGRLACAKLNVSEKSKRHSVRLDIADLTPIDDTVAPAAAASPRKALEELYKAINDFCLQKNNAPAFQPGTHEFTDIGREWAKANLGLVWDDLKLPEHHRVAELTEDQATALLGKLLEMYGFPPARTELTRPVTDF